MSLRRIGIDVGGTSIKGGVVDLVSSGMHRRDCVPTPFPARPADVAGRVADMVAPWQCPGPVGIALPCTVTDGVARTAVNIPSEWIGTDARKLFGEALGGRDVVVLNDTDAAALGEAHHGAADHPGTVLVLTFGTGVGSAVLRNGRLQPNTELGQLMVDGHVADGYVSLSARLAGGVSWSEWIERTNAFLAMLEDREEYDRIVIGGGVTHEAVHWEGRLRSRAPLVRACFLNMAGVVGAATAAEWGDLVQPCSERRG